MRSCTQAAHALLCLLLLIWPASGLAVEGATEINQASVQASGGFPFVISAAGKYVLTSDLIVPADTQAILLVASDVFIDLRGFRIVGPYSCSVVGCQTGLVNGIAGQQGLGRRITVTGGAVRGFSGTCVSLLGESYMSDMFVSRCGRIGVELSQGSLVRSTRVSETGRQGIRLVGETIGYGENVVYLTGLAVSQVGPESVGIDGGTAIGRNACLRGSCAPRGRRYYLTEDTFDGSQAADPTNCDAGFHFASIYEITDTTQLSYDQTRGATPLDQSEGPPALRQAWVKTGTGPSTATLAGSADCQGWTSANSNHQGSLVSLGANGTGTSNFALNLWNDPVNSTLLPWVGGTTQCILPRPIVCLEDW